MCEDFPEKKNNDARREGEGGRGVVWTCGCACLRSHETAGTPRRARLPVLFAMILVRGEMSSPNGIWT